MTENLSNQLLNKPPKSFIDDFEEASKSCLYKPPNPLACILLDPLSFHSLLFIWVQWLVFIWNTFIQKKKTKLSLPLLLVICKVIWCDIICRSVKRKSWWQDFFWHTENSYLDSEHISRAIYKVLALHNSWKPCNSQYIKCNWHGLEKITIMPCRPWPGLKSFLLCEQWT